jgi:REP element-mobilizing transposase RayT
LGDVVDGEVRLSPLGEIVTDCWKGISEHLPCAAVDVSIVMPNHMHGILFLHGERPSAGTVGATHAVSHRRAAGLRGTNGASPLHIPDTTSGQALSSLSAVVGSYKAASTRLINRQRGTAGDPVWQRGFYEHVIRDEADLHRIRRYIEENPLRWAEDEENR